MKRFFLLLVILGQTLSVSPGVSAQEPRPKTEKFLAGQITVPAGYKTEHLIGPDFDTFYVIPENTTSNTAEVMCGVYAGSFPGYYPPKTGVTTEPGSFAGKKFRWRIWRIKTGEKTSISYQAIVRLKGGQWLWHIFLAAPDMKRIQELKVILRSYRMTAD